MVEAVQRRTVSKEAGEAEGARGTYPHERRASVLKCNIPGCSGEASRLCNSCGEVYCVEHSTVQRGAGSTALFYKCALCAGKTHESANRFWVVSAFTALGLVGALLLWYVYTLVSKPALP